MASSGRYLKLKGSEHPHPKGFKKLGTTNEAEELTVTLLLRRKPKHVVLKPEHVMAGKSSRPTREAFAAKRGAAASELNAVVAFARKEGLAVVDADAARRSVILRGTTAQINKAFAVTLNDYKYARGTYRSHDGAVKLPPAIADYVVAVVGLTNRQVEVKHLAPKKAAAKGAAQDPADTKPLTPAQVASLYHFPDGDGAGETIGLYEMNAGAPAGYAISDIAATMKALGDLPMPKLVDVAVDGTQNSGKSDGETGLDITVAAGIAPKSTIVVYFAGAQTQNMIHALQQMILPKKGEPAPSVISISYTWGPDDQGSSNFSESEITQFTKLFEDAATNKISVFVSSGDSGAFVNSKTQAQTNYPGSDVWVTACGGTTIGNLKEGSFDEWVWNDKGLGGPGATGGGVSARFPVPAYQAKVKIPARNGSRKKGRGVPDIAGNASENSGYLQVSGGGRAQPVGGTSAVAPLYAGLMARINANLGAPTGYLNTTLYGLPAATFSDITGAAGPANNNYGKVKGYAAGPGWDPCTGLGSVNGKALQDALGKAKKSGKS